MGRAAERTPRPGPPGALQATEDLPGGGRWGAPDAAQGGGEDGPGVGVGAQPSWPRPCQDGCMMALLRRAQCCVLCLPRATAACVPHPTQVAVAGAQFPWQPSVLEATAAIMPREMELCFHLGMPALALFSVAWLVRGWGIFPGGWMG